MLSSLQPAKGSYKEFDYELMARISAKNNALREQRKANGVVEPYKRPKSDYLPDTAARAQAHKDKIARVNEARKLLHAKYAVKLSLPRAKT
ncbi:MAG: hypothetical protein ACREHD_14505 [Pirellulales bacterium]